jgi:hypothetical protein
MRAERWGVRKMAGRSDRGRYWVFGNEPPGYFGYLYRKGTEKTWWWCLHCERAFQAPKWIKHDRFGEPPPRCAFEDCDGNVLDIIPWSELRWGNEELPREPREGARYQLYYD